MDCLFDQLLVASIELTRQEDISIFKVHMKQSFGQMKLMLIE